MHFFNLLSILLTLILKECFVLNRYSQEKGILSDLWLLDVHNVKAWMELKTTHGPKPLGRYVNSKADCSYQVSVNL